MKNELLKIALRQNAIFIPQHLIAHKEPKISELSLVMVQRLAELGFTFSEELLHSINAVNTGYKYQILEFLKDVMGIDKNWTPLRKNFGETTNETLFDHVKTFLENTFKTHDNMVLACGHIIPQNTFNLSVYNGCPICGLPMSFGAIEQMGNGSKLKVLDLWTEDNLKALMVDLLQSKTALDATQVDSLKLLLTEFGLPNVEITMKETNMLAINYLVKSKQAEKANAYFNNPNDILRFLWYQKTGFLQIIEPKTILKRAASNNFHFNTYASHSAKSKLDKKAALKLKYGRTECLAVATWLNNLNMSAENACEIMHPKRGMWVRFIRALRLAEYSKRKGFEKLAALLDVFYNRHYTVWSGSVNHYRLRSDAEKTFALLKQRPGLFARSLFANMLWFGATETINEFKQVLDKVPARLVFTLNMYAQNYFDYTVSRSVKPLGGISKRIAANKLLTLYTKEQLHEMKLQVEELCFEAMKKRFAALNNDNKTIYIDEALFNMPVSIGDRSETLQDLPVALMGTRFLVEGNTVRLFMQWGKDLPAQHLDMDLSCVIAYENKMERCSYSNLIATGCKHSGDIIHIPNKIGTAEYIEMNLDVLKKAQAKYVTFTCNAYSNGSIAPNLVIGWMNSKYPMHISNATGVAYDPSCVQHQVRVTKSATKGLVFGVLDVEKNQIIWLEMAFAGQVVQGLDFNNVSALIAKLGAKLNIGALLMLKAEAQGLTLVTEKQNADEIYDIQWAMNAAAVTQLFVD